MSDYDPDRDPDGLRLSGTTARGYVRGIAGADDFRIRELEYAEVDGEAVFEGCIVLGTLAQMAAVRATIDGMGGPDLAADLEAFGNTIVGRRYLWPKGIVPFAIDPNLPDQARVAGAIEHWTEKTEIEFKAHTTEADYITFRPARGCSSNVGRQGGQQYINLGPRCSKGNTIHEIGHALGLWHEQSRADRDAFIEVRLENVIERALHNFSQTVSNGKPHGGYDYASIMHYSAFAFSKNNEPTIVARNGAAIGQREGLSAGDIATIADLYSAEFAKR